MVENIRQESSLSHAVSTELLRSVLVSLVDAHKDLNVLVPSLINTLKVSYLNNKWMGFLYLIGTFSNVEIFYKKRLGRTPPSLPSYFDIKNKGRVV